MKSVIQSITDAGTRLGQALHQLKEHSSVVAHEPQSRSSGVFIVHSGVGYWQPLDNEGEQA